MRFPAVFLLAVAGLTAAAPPASAREKLDASEILRRAEEVRSPDRDYAVDFTLHVVSPDSVWKERTARYTMIAHGKDHSLVLVRQPKSFYPGTLLIERHRYWLMFPRSQKPIQLSAQQILNGDISNGDLTRGNLLNHYKPRIDGEEKLDGKRCWRLELTQNSNVVHYPRIRYWIDKKKLRPVKFEYYGKTGALLKTAHYEDYRKGPLGVRSMRIVVETYKREDEKTTMTFTNLREIDTSPLSFTREGMIAFRDLAREKYQAEGEQAQPEDLIAELGAGAP